MKRLSFSGRFLVTLDCGWSYTIEPLGEVDGGWMGRCLDCLFLDSRGYWDQGLVRLDRVVSMQPELGEAA